MIDPLSVIVGLLVGGFVGTMIGVFKYAKLVDQLQFENDRLMRERTARGAGGRFVRADRNR